MKTFTKGLRDTLNKSIHAPLKDVSSGRGVDGFAFVQRFLCSIIVLLAVISIIPQMTVFAASKDGITLSVDTDKESYKSGQEIDVSVTVKNTNAYLVSGVSVTVELPKNLRLVSGDLNVSDIILQTGETYQRTVKAMKPGETKQTGSTTSAIVPTQIGPVKPTTPTLPTKQTYPTEQTKTTQKSSKTSDNEYDSHKVSPKTGEMSLLPFWMMVYIMPIIAAAALITIRKQQYYAKNDICLPAKSLISLALVLSLAFSMAPANVMAAKVDEQDTTEIIISAEKYITVDGEKFVIKASVTYVYQKYEPEYTYREKEDGTIAVTGYNGSDSALTIPASIDGKKVSEISDSAFAGLLCLKTICVPEGVTHIGNYAFECCSLLKKIYLPESLRSIGDGAFSGCGCLTLVDMQEGVKTIGNGAFLCCNSLVQLELSEALTNVGEFAFAYCEDLSSLRFNGDKVTALPDRIFYGCHSLSSLRLPDKITSVGKRAFSGCQKLQSLYFGEPLTSLGAYAFENCAKLSSLTVSARVIPTGMVSGCSELSWFSVADGTVRIEKEAFGSSGVTSISIPASVTEIEAGAFFHVRGSLTLDEENTSYRLIDGSLYTPDGKTLLAFFSADPYAEEPQTECTVPDGVETIASYAFAESELTNVILPSSLKKIDAYAFAYTNIENMAIPEGVTVDPAAFGDPGQEDNTPEDSGEGEAPLEIGSVAGEKNLFREEDYAGYKQIANDNFDAWCEQYLAYNQSRGITLNTDSIPYIIRYKGEVIPHYIPMTAVQNRDPAMWTEAASAFGDDFEPLYLMMNHGLFTELARGKMEEPLILYSGLYDSQLMAAAGTDVLPTQQQLVDAIGSTFTDPIMISTTTDPGIAAGFGDTLFIIYASPETMDDLGAVCIDAVVHSQEKEILMNHNARYRILDVGNIAIQHQEPWEDEPTTLYRHYVKVELLK